MTGLANRSLRLCVVVLQLPTEDDNRVFSPKVPEAGGQCVTYCLLFLLTGAHVKPYCFASQSLSPALVLFAMLSFYLQLQAVGVVSSWVSRCNIDESTVVLKTCTFQQTYQFFTIICEYWALDCWRFLGILVLSILIHQRRCYKCQMLEFLSKTYLFHDSFHFYLCPWLMLAFEQCLLIANFYIRASYLSLLFIHNCPYSRLLCGKQFSSRVITFL